MLIASFPLLKFYSVASNELLRVLVMRRLGRTKFTTCFFFSFSLQNIHKPIDQMLQTVMPGTDGFEWCHVHVLLICCLPSLSLPSPSSSLYLSLSFSLSFDTIPFASLLFLAIIILFGQRFFYRIESYCSDSLLQTSTNRHAKIGSNDRPDHFWCRLLSSASRPPKTKQKRPVCVNMRTGA